MQVVLWVLFLFKQVKSSNPQKVLFYYFSYMKIWFLYLNVSIVTAILFWLLLITTDTKPDELILLTFMVEIVVLLSLFIYRNYPS